MIGVCHELLAVKGRSRRLHGYLRAVVAAIALIAGGTLSLPAVAQSFTLNLQDADIDTLITTVSEVTGRNFIVDPRVQGKVTVISARPLRDDEVYQVFLSVLKVHGFVAVQAGNVTKIVPEAVGRTGAGSTGASTDEIVTRVIPVRNVRAERLVPALRPLLPKFAHLAAQPDSNALVISATRGNVERVRNMVARMDVGGRADVEIIALKHATAGEIANTVNGLRPADALYAPIVADGRTNSLLVSGDPSTRKRLRSVVTRLDTPQRGAGNTQVVRLKYARAEDMVVVLEGITGGAARASNNQDGVDLARVTTIHADPSMNALVVSSTPAHMRTLLDVLKQLDVRREQVLVEGIIAEMTGQRAEQLGVQWRVPTNPMSSGVIGGTNFTGSGVASSIANFATNPISSVSGLGLGLIDGTFTFNGTEFANFALLVRALSADTDVNILSTPSIVTIDNRSAEIVVAQNVPFITGQYTSAGSNASSANPFQTIERQDIGLILRVRPQVNESNELMLEIQQEVSSISPSAAVQGSNTAVDLVTNKRSIRTAVMVEDGEVLVLGGLIREALTEVKEKVPLLGDLPLIGRLFRNDDTAADKTNLMVFLRPTILRNGATRKVTQGRYDQTRQQQQKRNADGVNLMPGKSEPVLPALKGLIDQVDPINWQVEDDAGQ
jgi:general secretion pathway protein D